MLVTCPKRRAAAGGGELGRGHLVRVRPLPLPIDFPRRSTSLADRLPSTGQKWASFLTTHHTHHPPHRLVLGTMTTTAIPNATMIPQHIHFRVLCWLLRAATTLTTPFAT